MNRRFMGAGEPSYAIEVVLSNCQESYLWAVTFKAKAEAMAERDRLVNQPEYGIERACVVAVWPDELATQGVR